MSDGLVFKANHKQLAVIIAALKSEASDDEDALGMSKALEALLLADIAAHVPDNIVLDLTKGYDNASADEAIKLGLGALHERKNG